ncbi:MAG: ABC transporter permease [Bacteroidota bacterium]
MLKLLIAKELREIIGTTKFAVTFAVCAVLLLLAFYVGARNYQVAQAEYDAAVTENLNQMAGLTEWGEVDHRVFLPPQPLAVLVNGIANDIGRTVEMRRRGELRAENSRFNEDTIYAVFRFLDLDFIFTIVLSLFAILFAYDSINGEKERGTLRLSFANAVPRDQYLIGKIIGAFLALVIPLLIPILIGCLLLIAMGIPVDGGEWGRLALILGAGLLYFTVFLTLSVFISALTQNSASSFLMLLVVWIFAVLIIPRAAVLISGRAIDVPSIDRINFEKSNFQRQQFSDYRQKTQAYFAQNRPEGGMGQEFFAQFQEESRKWQEENEAAAEVFNGKLNEDRQNREQVQQRVALNISRLSPASAFSLAASELAGTSLALRSAFLESVNEYKTTYSTFIEEKTGDSNAFVRFGQSNDEEEEEPDPIDPQELPQYQFSVPDTGTLLSRAAIDFGVLAIFNVLFFAGAFVAFLKYDVR